MRYLPIAFDVRDKPCLVVGAGSVALRKIELLLSAGAKVRVVATHACTKVNSLAAQATVELSLRPFAPSDLEHVTLVIAATDDARVNAAVAALARERSVPINVVDQPELCSFIVPAIIDRDPILIAISTQGASPVLARSLRTRLEALLSPRLGELARFASRHRAQVRAAVPEPAARRRLWERVIDGLAGKQIVEGDTAAAEATLARALADSSLREHRPIELIASPASEDALTLSELRSLAGADLIVFDQASEPLARRFARRDASSCAIDHASRWLIELRGAWDAGGAVCLIAREEALAAAARALTTERFETRNVGGLERAARRSAS